MLFNVKFTIKYTQPFLSFTIQRLSSKIELGTSQTSGGEESVELGLAMSIQLTLN
jgi:hypothetical protein